MYNLLEVAKLFSEGRFDQVSNRLCEEVSFHIYEEDRHIVGKAPVLKFCEGISKYFESMDTDFRETGSLVAYDKVVIYGYAEFRKGGELVNSVNSCDIYEFDNAGMISKIQSYCNSKPKL